MPYCFFKLINWRECTVGKWQVLKDLCFIFFKYRYFPDNYGPCRLYEKPREAWPYYYGSSYNAYPRHRLRREVQPFEYRILFYDKYVTYQLCKSMDIMTPVCYGTIHQHMDYRKAIRDIFHQKNPGKLIFKPLRGHGGIGIFVVWNEDNTIFANQNDEVIPLADLRLKDSYIIQEVIRQNRMIDAISPASLNTVRVVTMYTKNDDAMVVSSSMRFSTGNSVVDNWSSGGVAVGVDHRMGALKEIAYDKLGNKYMQHPLTNIRFSGIQVPFWKEIIECALKVQREFPYYKLLGTDIAVMDDGPVLIEINADADLVFQEQTSGPLLEDDEVLRVFYEYDLLINKYQKALLKKHDIT